MTQLHVRHFPGDAERPAIALHCMMGTGAYWGPIARLLQGVVDLRAPDLLGHGRSPAWQALSPAADLDYHTRMTRTVAALIDRPLDLIGHSFGATVALRIAVAAPEAVRSLTLIEPVIFAAAPDPNQTLLFSKMADLIDAGDAHTATAMFLQEWGLKDENGTPPVLDSFLRQILIVRDTNDAMMDDRANSLREGGIEAIDAPIMIIQGSDSPVVVHSIAEALAARMQDVGVATVPGSGHMLPITHPDAVADLIATNLERA